MRLYQHIILTVLVLTVFLNSIRISLVYSYYYLDPVGFIENLCKNTDEPAMQCNGKCYLKKVSKTDNNDSKSVPIPKIDLKETLLFFSPNNINIDTHFSTNVKHLFTYTNLYNHSVNSSVYPPRV